MSKRRTRPSAFTLTEVVLAIGIVGFSVLATVGLLSVASDTNRRSRDETFAARLVSNEFERIRSLQSNFPQGTLTTRVYDSDLAEVQAGSPKAVYKLDIAIAAPSPSPRPADLIFNATVAYPASAPSPTRVRFTTLMNIPRATPTPTPPPTP
jgi:uncharacterized protein (TIGR02598 family)